MIASEVFAVREILQTLPGFEEIVDIQVAGDGDVGRKPSCWLFQGG